MHHHLLREGTRTRVGLVVESGEPREVHHFALLIGYGASAINPYLAFETLHDMIRQGLLAGADPEKAEQKYVKAVSKGIVKVCSKMGISTIQSYHGAQVFEADRPQQRLHRRVLHLDGVAHRAASACLRSPPRCACATSARSRIGRCRRTRWIRAASTSTAATASTTCSTRRASTSCSTPAAPATTRVYKEYAKLVDDQAKHLCTLRGLMELDSKRPPVPIDEVESVDALVKRFKTGAMSYGSISSEAHETLAIAMNRIGGKSNTGEGGEDPARYVRDANGDSRNSAIKQVASGRFGVTSDYLVNARRAADQDGAGREARRGRPAARVQGLSLDRQGAPLDAGRGPDLAAAPPRHLLDRGSGAADPRPQEREHARRASA